ncbi:MAG: hypothetical protein GY906_23210 [bacterium]|nr:hypothetical protein [bacterium]
MSKKAPVPVNLAKSPQVVVAPASKQGRDVEYDTADISAKPGFPEGHPLHGKTEGDGGLALSAVDGKPTILKKFWSNAGTGLWLVIGICRPPILGHIVEIQGSPMVLTIYTEDIGRSGAFMGNVRRPVAPKEGVWTCLELPSDLAQDELKQEYVRHWIEHTTAEMLQKAAIAVEQGTEVVLATEVKLDTKKIQHRLAEVLKIVEDQLDKTNL